MKFFCFFNKLVLILTINEEKDAKRFVKNLKFDTVKSICIERCFEDWRKCNFGATVRNHYYLSQTSKCSAKVQGQVYRNTKAGMYINV